MSKSESDPINPSYYKVGGYEPIVLIEQWGLGFHVGCALKYVARAGKKSPDVLTDLKKARWYLDRACTQDIPAHVNAKSPHSGFTTTALAAANVWGLDLNLLNVVVSISQAAGSDTWALAAVREKLKLALASLDKAIAAHEGKG